MAKMEIESTESSTVKTDQAVSRNEALTGQPKQVHTNRWNWIPKSKRVDDGSRYKPPVPPYRRGG